MSELRPLWIGDEEGLRALAEELTRCRRFAVDSEGDSLSHYRHKVCLVQVSTESATYVIDPLTVRDLSALAPAAADPRVEKLLHAACHDLAWLRRDHGLVFSHVFDTQVAASLLGFTRLGLDVLLWEVLGVAHTKQCQRDDWSRRPLSQEQVGYAARDSHYLIPLRDALHERLVEKGRLAWALEEFAYLAPEARATRSFDPEGYRRVRGASGLRDSERAVLRELVALRERIAEEQDVPPFRVVPDAVVVTLAKAMPATHGELARCRVPPRVLARYGEALFEAIDRGRREGAPSRPRRPKGTRPSPEALARMGRLKAWRAARARDLELPAWVVLPGRTLRAVAEAAPADEGGLSSIEGMRRWRVEEFGAEILAALGAP